MMVKCYSQNDGEIFIVVDDEKKFIYICANDEQFIICVKMMRKTL